MPFRSISSFSGSRFARFARTVHSAWPRVAQAALPNLCALCGNLSHTTICAGCNAAYWNEGRLRCTVCAVPLLVDTVVASVALPAVAQAELKVRLTGCSVYLLEPFITSTDSTDEP